MRIFILILVLGINITLYAQGSDNDNARYSKADSIATVFKGNSLDNLRALSLGLTTNLPDDEQKFRAIYRWVCDNIANDPTLYEINKRKREKYQNEPFELNEWNKSFVQKVFKQLRKNYSTVCSGYAYLIKQLAYHSDIECVIIDGYGRTVVSNVETKSIPNHSWNAVKLNGKWYLCDATWSSGIINPAQGRFITSFSEGYFLTEPSLFAKNHYPLDTAWLLMDKKPSFDQFLNAPLLYKGAFNEKLLPTAKAFKREINKGDTVPFTLKKNNASSPQFITYQIVKGNDVELLEAEVHPNLEGEIAFDHTFNNKGKYLVHILNYTEYICTFKIEVN
ncbi:transglutaminase domain-containing protein [Fulvivirga ligni]|uniref:transglutaminase domain-containing protein n=1 Tax=Fulvivirga ligni TaxID=2904246 RepID=UPI001F3E2379|nr:hypothetical protein [Fulvivirga ligni]UII19441.1 hypothetical protein LVD16_16500 [Fulvivirga ligni]